MKIYFPKNAISNYEEGSIGLHPESFSPDFDAEFALFRSLTNLHRKRLYR